jgi:Domain of Unknown Function (DUF928)
VNKTCGPFFIFIAFIFALPPWTHSEDGASQSVRAPIYREPFPDAPEVRVDGVARGADSALLTLTVLAPKRVGETTKEQPSLFWFQSKATTNRFELTIIQGKKPEPFVELTLNEPSTEGVQRLRLSQLNIKLAEGVEYRWAVSMVLDAKRRIKDVVASGVIKRIPPSKELLGRLAKSSPSEAPFIYADDGIWYDSLESLSDLIEKRPQDQKLHEERAIFFMQEGLEDAALYEGAIANAEQSNSSK